MDILLQNFLELSKSKQKYTLSISMSNKKWKVESLPYKIITDNIKINTKMEGLTVGGKHWYLISDSYLNLASDCVELNDEIGDVTLDKLKKLKLTVFYDDKVIFPLKQLM
jgi:hypothetical protein